MKTKILLEKCKTSFGGYKVKQITGEITVFCMNPEANRSVDMIKELTVHTIITESEAKCLVKDERYLVTVK